MKKPLVDRRRFLLGSAVATFAGALPAATRHDGELGGPQETIRGGVPWQEGAADVPPGASGTGYEFFTPAEAAFIEAALARLIPKRSPGAGRS